MTHDQEAELIGLMLEAYYKKINRTFSGGQLAVVRENMRAALAVAKPIIRDDALEEAAMVAHTADIVCSSHAPMTVFLSTKNQIAAAVRALKSKGQKPQESA